MVTVYSKERCVQCNATVRKLKELGVKFEEVDMSEDPEALEHAKELGYLSAPVVITETGEHWNGYRPDKIASL